jgi:hypothetical protein
MMSVHNKSSAESIIEAMRDSEDDDITAPIFATSNNILATTFILDQLATRGSWKAPHVDRPFCASRLSLPLLTLFFGQESFDVLADVLQRTSPLYPR